MPDKHSFDHLVERGRITHRCIEEGCGWPEETRAVSEEERQRHARQHARARTRAAEKARDAALAKARQVKRQHTRENTRAYGEE